MDSKKFLAEISAMPSAMPPRLRPLRSTPIVSNVQGAVGMDPNPIRKLTGWEKVRFRTQIGDLAMVDPGKKNTGKSHIHLFSYIRFCMCMHQKRGVGD